MLTGLCHERHWVAADGGHVVLCWSPPLAAPPQFLTCDASIWMSGASNAIFNLMLVLVVEQRPEDSLSGSGV